MSRRRSSTTSTRAPAIVRCAIYTRKSSEEGLRQEFNSLDAQREAAEAYIASQKAEGWVALADLYDDGGFSGANTDRPAFQRLMTDVREGRIDAIVVYKIDRFSRSLLDFARIMEALEQYGVSLVAVTQQFNTTSSMGRLTLNILLSFAQFEREIIGERIRDKLAASRQKGKWTGGTPVLGYDVDRSTGSPRLVINPVEASRVRQIFELYVELGSLLPVVDELERRDWRTKAWTTRAGSKRGARPFDRCRLHALLTNVLYAGKVTHKKEIYAGEHEAIIPEDLFKRVQTQLQRNGRAGSAEFRNRHGALLRGLLYCKSCGRAMVHTFTSRGSKCYRYYTCTNAIKRGRRKCPTKSLPAGEIERAVVEEIRGIGRDPELVRETVRQARGQIERDVKRLVGERRVIVRGVTRLNTEIRRLATGNPSMVGVAERIADQTDQVREAEQRLVEIDSEIAARRADLVNEADVASALANFDQIWTALTPKEQARVLRLLVDRVEFDASESTMEIAFHSPVTGVLAPGDDSAEPAEDAA